MKNSLLILLLTIASCTEPLVPTQTYCVHYRIGNGYTTSTVAFVDGYVVCDNWRLSVASTVDNQTRLFRDTTIQTELGIVYRSSTFLFANGQSGGTLKGMYISHNKGSICDTYDTLDVEVIRIPCNNTEGESWH